MNKVKVLIVGFGNVGRGVKSSIENNEDMELVGVISRNPERVAKELPNVKTLHIDDVENWLKLGADVAILCGGSKNDLPIQGPQISQYINTVDSFDNHSCIPEYFESVDTVAQKSNKVSVISTGWDPGIFSLERVLSSAFIPGAKSYGFYGLGEKGGLSMGHSDALRTIDGVKDARQYTHAIPEAIEKIRNGENPNFAAGDMHTRECFVVVEDGANKEKITETILNMPGYFAPYKTTVNFISQDELNTKFAGFPHDGLVISAGTTGDNNSARIEYRCIWGSNPEATGNVLVAHARAAYRLSLENKKGAFTILDIPASYFSLQNKAQLLKNWM